MHVGHYKFRAVQAYYEGYIAGGCTKDEKNGIVLRRFSKVSGGTLKTYQCERACQGCKNNDDCKLAALTTHMRNALLLHVQVLMLHSIDIRLKFASGSKDVFPMCLCICKECSPVCWGQWRAFNIGSQSFARACIYFVHFKLGYPIGTYIQGGVIK